MNGIDFITASSQPGTSSLKKDTGLVDDLLEVDKTFYAALDDLPAEINSPKEGAEILIPLTEDSIRCMKEMIGRWAQGMQYEGINSLISEFIPGLPSELLLMADRLYTAFRTGRFDIATLDTLRIVSCNVLNDDNDIARMAQFVRETLKDYVGEHLFSAEVPPEENHPSTYFVLGMTALLIATQYKLQNNKPSQRLLFNFPRIFRNMMMRTKIWLNQIDNIASHVGPGCRLTLQNNPQPFINNASSISRENQQLPPPLRDREETVVQETTARGKANENIVRDAQAERLRNIHYPGRIYNARIRYIPGPINREEALRKAANLGHKVYGSGHQALERIRQQHGQKGVNRAMQIQQATVSANEIADKARTILAQALDGNHQQLLNSLRDEVIDIVGNVGREEIDRILYFLHERNNLVAGITSFLPQEGYPNIVFAFMETPEQQALVFRNDASCALFFNINGETLGAHKVILHEVSHFTGTLDFFYQTSGVGFYTPTKKLLQAFRRAQSVEQLKHAAGPLCIKVLFGLHPFRGVVGEAHYQAAFHIYNSPDFAVEMLKNNADSYVDFIETLDKKYIFAQGQAVVNPHYRPRT